MKTNDYVKSVIELAEDFRKKAENVEINTLAVKQMAESLEGCEVNPICSTSDRNERRFAVLRELLASSVNFCYWYGCPNSNTRNKGSAAMYKILDSVMPENKEAIFSTFVQSVINDFEKALMENRFSMLEERRLRLQHLRDNSPSVVDFCIDVASGRIGFESLLPELFALAPEFADDLFLKRAFLFPLILNRNIGLFEEDIHLIPVPADYQIPKMLNAKDILLYRDDLQKMIDNAQIIEKGSQLECEIRACTIIACKEISEQAGVTMQLIDDYLFSIRKTVNSNYHLTRTTDY